MSEVLSDRYEHYNYDQDKYLFCHHSGKQRTKREASAHTNRPDPCGHVRKLVTKMMNTESKRKAARGRDPRADKPHERVTLSVEAPRQ